MKKVIDFPNKDLILETAAQWLVRMDEGPLDAEEKREFRQWLAQSPEYVAIFRDTLSTWQSMTSLEGLSEVFPLETLEVKKQTGRRAYDAKIRWSWPAGITTVMATFTLLTVVYILSVSGMYQTDIGEKEVIRLSDGSTVTLNTDTKLKVSFSKNIRRIDLHRGEAFFQVAKDVQRPFLVIANENVVTAVGTAFSVYKTNGAIKVIVSEGVVQLQSSAIQHEPPEQDKKKSEPEIRPQSPVYLEVGQVAVYENAVINVASVDSEKIEKELIWREDMLAFDGQPLAEVIAEFQRYTKLKIQVDESVGDIRVGGYFKSDDIEGMLNSLQFNFGVQVARLDDNHVRLEKQK